MQNVVLVLVATALVALATYLVSRSGLRSGDRPGDSRVTVRLLARPQADTAGGYAEVRVDNFGDAPVVASAVVEPIAAWTLPLRSPKSVHTAARRRAGSAPSGTGRQGQVVVVDGGGVAGIFEVALPGADRTGEGPLKAVRARVTVHQAEGRVRVVTFALPVPSTLQGVAGPAHHPAAPGYEAAQPK